MPSFRMTSSNPFWFEDLVFSVWDESRRLPERATKAYVRARRYAETGIETLLKYKAAVRRLSVASEPVKAVPVAVEARPRVFEAELLDDPLTWSLATEPLASSVASVEKVLLLQEKADEQLGAITYVLDRMRDDLAPVLTRTRSERTPKAEILNRDELDMSIEALLALSRRNAATRPKDRLLNAA